MTRLIAEGVKLIGKRLVAGEQDKRLVEVGRRIEKFEIESYERLCAEAKKRENTHEHALLKSILGQEKLAHQLLGEVGAGKGPLRELVEKASLKQAGAK